MKMKSGVHMAVALLTVLILTGRPAFAQTKPYAPKNGVLNLKAVFLGGGFRVTTAIPLHGNFSKYHRLEIVHPESLIGGDVPAAFLEKLGTELQAEFEKGGRFGEVAIVGPFDPSRIPPQDQMPPTGENFRESDPLETPIRGLDDLHKFDEQRQQAEQLEEAGDTGALVIRSQVIDYAKGNKILQLSMSDLGNAILTIRFSYFDKETGEELGRSVISSDNSAKIVPSAFTTRSALSGVADGLVDQITRRKIAGER